MEQYIWYIVAVLTSAFAGLFVKWYIKTNNNIYLYSSILCQLILVVAYIKLFNDNDISSSYPFIKILSIIIVAIIGFSFLNEIITIKTIIGILLGGISIFLLS